MDANQIRDLVREKGLTQTGIAEEIGITPQAVAEIIAGRTTSSTARYAFAKAIQESVSMLWPEEASATSAAAR